MKIHVPVMVAEVIEHLNLAPGKIIIDATLGGGGHSLEVLKRIGPSGRLIAIDRDQTALEGARQRLVQYAGQCQFIHGNFKDIDKIAGDLKIRKVDGILIDLGVSSMQLEDPERGFSFQADGPLDMRMDKDSYISAYDLVNNLNEEELSHLLWNFGEERFHNRIARFLVKEREKHPITSTLELSSIVCRAMPPRFRHQRIHPATRTFQAVRIAVNRELEALQETIGKAVDLLDKNGRICIISFHSLEDRIVKHTFKDLQLQGTINIITPKPLTPSEEEVRQNSASRSSKLRAAERN